MDIGYVGLGDMGGALAERLATQHALRVFDLDSHAMRRHVDRGASAEPSLAALAGASDVVLLCLPTSEHVRSVVFDRGGLAENLRDGALIIDQTSGDPNATRQFAADLGSSGIALVDAPVSGGATAALAGNISIMLGADDRDVERASAVLALISPVIAHVGGVGAGHTMKLVNNLLSCSQRLLSLEALAIAVKAGVDPSLAVDVLSKGGGRNGYLEAQAQRTLEGDRHRGFSLALAHKDLRLASQLGADLGAPTFFGSLSQSLYQAAIAELGGGAHVEVIAEFVEKFADVALVKPD